MANMAAAPAPLLERTRTFVDEGQPDWVTERVIFRRCVICGDNVAVKQFHLQFSFCDSCLVKNDYVPRYKRLCDEKVEPDDWPTEPQRYVDAEACPPSSKLTTRQQFREFILGAGCFHTPGDLDPDDVEREYPRMAEVSCGRHMPELFGKAEDVLAGPPKAALTFHNKVMLLTEMITELRLYPSKLRDSNMEAIRGITFVKDDSFMELGCIDADRMSVLKLDPEFPFIKRIVLQHTIWETDDRTHRLAKRLTFIRIEPHRGEKVECGTWLKPGLHGKDNEWVLPLEAAEGTLVIVGVGLAHTLPLSFQLVDVSADPGDSLDTLFLCRDMISCVSVTTDLALYEHCGMPAVEDPEVYSLLEDLLDGIENTSPSDAELLPNAIKFIDKTEALETATMFSIFRMDRYMMHILQGDCKVGMFNKEQNHWRKLLPLKQMVSIVSDVAMNSRRLELHKPQLNVYSYAILTGSRWDAIKAYLTFCTQLMFIAMLIGGIDVSAFGDVPEYMFVAVTRHRHSCP
eukprot:TRINITY_DN3775_c0_g1_i1.p1 TRINITY_DN3775_c0_g1~~TRINITY_DN3775_c0_g1_i1.p1  ORF type:complete len:522 (+),score=213.06 TRINITY_DN3775_c0_g1_i1:23-1567(+)